MVGDLLDNNVEINGRLHLRVSHCLMTIFISWFPFLLLNRYLDLLHASDAGRWQVVVALCRSVKAKRSMLGEDEVNVTFKDVAGAEEAKEEVCRNG